MSNDEVLHCGNCKHFENVYCKLRNETIKSPQQTTCRNSNSAKSKPDGVIFAIVREVKKGIIAYRKIPYYNGLRVDAIKDGPDETNVFWESYDGHKLIFKDVDEYLIFYEKELIKKRGFIIGAVIGDIIGSVYEWNNIKTVDFPLFNEQSDFTDDSVLTFAT